MKSSDKFAPVDRPAPFGWRRNLAVFLATGVGVGYCPVASGTFGTLWGIPLVWAMQSLPLWGQIPVAATLVALAIPICHQAEAVLQRKDDGRIVADEYLAFPLCMLGLPHSMPVIVLAFLSFRLFDIVKPPPAGRLQRIPGGTGIVIDDVIAALYSLGLNHLVFWLMGRVGVL